MEKKYGIPWFKINFIGAGATAKSLRKIATYFENPKLTAQVEEVNASAASLAEMAQVLNTVVSKFKLDDMTA